MTGTWQPSLCFVYSLLLPWSHVCPFSTPGAPRLTRPNLWPNFRAGVTVTHDSLRPERQNKPRTEETGSREDAAEGQSSDDLLGVTLSISTLSLRSSSLGPTFPEQRPGPLAGSTPASIPPNTSSPHPTQSPSEVAVVHQQAQGAALAAPWGCRPACHASSLSSPTAIVFVDCLQSTSEAWVSLSPKPKRLLKEMVYCPTTWACKKLS